MSASESKKTTIFKAGTVVAGLAATAALASRAAAEFPSETFSGFAVGVATLVVAIIPAEFAAKRTLRRMGRRGEEAFSALGSTRIGKVLGKVSSGTMAGSVLATGAILTMGHAVPGLAENLTSAQAWAGAVIPAAGVLALMTVQEGLDRDKENSAQKGQTRIDLGAVDNMEKDPAKSRRPGGMP